MSQTIDLKTGTISWLPPVPDDYDPVTEDRPFTRRLREIHRGECRLPGEGGLRWMSYQDMSNVIGGRPSASWFSTLVDARNPWGKHRPPAPSDSPKLQRMMRAESQSDVTRWIIREWYGACALPTDLPRDEDYDHLLYLARRLGDGVVG